MNKQEFMDILYMRLYNVDPAWKADVLSDIESHFAEAARQGYTEEETSEHLGNPVELAESIYEEAVLAGKIAVDPVSFGNVDGIIGRRGRAGRTSSRRYAAGTHGAASSSEHAKPKADKAANEISGEEKEGTDPGAEPAGGGKEGSSDPSVHSSIDDMIAELEEKMKSVSEKFETGCDGLEERLKQASDRFRDELSGLFSGVPEEDFEEEFEEDLEDEFDEDYDEAGGADEEDPSGGEPLFGIRLEDIGDAIQKGIRGLSSLLKHGFQEGFRFGSDMVDPDDEIITVPVTDSIRKVEVLTLHPDITVRGGVKEPYVSYPAAIPSISVQCANGILRVEQEPSGYGRQRNVSHLIEIGLPDLPVDLLLNTKVGDITVRGFASLHSVNCVTSAGDISVAVRNCLGDLALTSSGDQSVEAATVYGNTALISSSGDVDLSGHSYHGDLTLKTASGDGDIDLYEVFGSCSVSTASGDVSVRLHQSLGNVSVYSASGDIDFTVESAPGDVSLRASSGDINATLPSEPAFSRSIRTYSGDLSFSHEPPTAENAMHHLTVTTYSGDINLDFE